MSRRSSQTKSQQMSTAEHLLTPTAVSQEAKASMAMAKAKAESAAAAAAKGKQSAMDTSGLASTPMNSVTLPPGSHVIEHPLLILKAPSLPWNHDALEPFVSAKVCWRVRATIARV